MKKTILIGLTFFSLNAFCQKEQAPPPAASPQKENLALIDELMQVSNYETFFKTYCNEKIEMAAKEKKWNPETLEKRKNEVNFDDFKRFTIYNSFSFVTEKQLKELINLTTELNKKTETSFFVTNLMVQSNLERFVKRYLRAE